MASFLPPEASSRGAPTLKTIAFLTGLGVSTVSRALKDGSEISLETRARVKEIARQIGYRPNRAGLRLKTGKTNVISVVLNPGDDGSGFFSNFVYGISDALAGTPYHLVVTPYSLSDPMEPIRYIVETSSADGVILTRTQPDDPRIRYLAEAGIPFATHGRTDMGIVHPFHDFDNAAFAEVAVAKLAARGRNRIALLGAAPEFSYSRHMQQGFEAAMRRFGFTAIPFSSVDSDATLQRIKASASELAASPLQPDGIVCGTISASLAAMAGFDEAGRVLGKDYDVVTKPAADLLDLIRPGIIAVPEDFREAGRDTARMVMSWIAGESPTRLQRLVIPTLP